MSASGEAARSRRAQIVALSFTELLLLLVFMSIAFTFLSKEEGKRNIPLVQRQRDEARAELKIRTKELALAKAQVNALQQENERLNGYIKALTSSATSIAPDISPFPPPGYGIEQLRALAREQRTIITALQGQIRELQTRLNGGKAPGLPICTVTSGFMINFALEADGSFVGAPGWKSEMAFAVQDIDGVEVLASGRNLNAAQFAAEGAKVKAWGLKQSQPCTVRVSYARNTTDAGIFERQLKALGDAFYVGRSR